MEVRSCVDPRCFGCQQCLHRMELLDTSTKTKFAESLRKIMGPGASRYAVRLAVRMNWTRLERYEHNYNNYFGLVRYNLPTAVARARLRVARRKKKFMAFAGQVLSERLPSDLLRVIFSYYTYT